MEYQEVPGKRGGVFYQTTDDHLYRFNRKGKDNKIWVYCYHIKLTRDAEVTQKCKVFGVLDPEVRKILIVN